MLVIVAIGLAVAIPSLLLRGGSEPLAPLQLPSTPEPPPAAIPASATTPQEAVPERRTLVLYDRTAKWGWLGELYATMTGNLVSHFGSWSAQPVARYSRGELARFDAVVYIGSTFNEPLPNAFLDDVLASTRPVLWLNANIWQLERRAPDFERRYGFATNKFDRSPIRRVLYKGTELSRWTKRTGGVMSYARIDASRVRTLGEAVRSDGARFPWAIRARNLTYIGEIPFPIHERSGSRARLLRSALRSARAADRRAPSRARSARGHQPAQRPRRATGSRGLPPRRRDPIRFRRQPPLPRHNGGRRQRRAD